MNNNLLQELNERLAAIALVPSSKATIKIKPISIKQIKNVVDESMDVTYFDIGFKRAITNILKANIKNNFNKIKNNFHNTSKYPSTQKGYTETNNIFLKSKNNLFKNRVMWNFMKNRVLSRLTPPPKNVSRTPIGKQSRGKW